MPGESAPFCPRSLVWATEIDVLPLDALVERQDGFTVIRSPSNPTHYWGNLLLFDRPPEDGDGLLWERLFDAEFGDGSSTRHRTFAWDVTNGELGAASGEFVARGYDLEESIGLVATPDQLQPHPRENRDVIVRALDPAADAEADFWQAVVEVQVEGRKEGHAEDAFRTFSRSWLEGRRAQFRAGRGAWYVALDPASGAVAGSCGIVVTGGRGRFQAVNTAVGFRRRGVCSRLVVEAGRHAVAEHGAERLVIVADVGYHALGLYESLGFEPAERVAGVCRWPRAGAG